MKNKKQKEQKIIDYLVTKYQPIGIILIGSRVNGEESPTSDWDLDVFSDKKETSIKDDFYTLKEFEGEALEVSLHPTTVSDDFVMETASHPVSEAKILYDQSKGLMKKIINNTKKAYSKKPPIPSDHTLNLRRKILNKFLRKAMSRPKNLGYVFFGISQFYIYAIRYWFEVKREWPLPIYRALPYIKSKDIKYYRLLQILISPSTPYNKKIDSMKKLRDNVNPIK